MDQSIKTKAESWLNSPAVDVDTKSEIESLMAKNPASLEDAFYRDLEFGTGGLRGVMGVGTNRMNRYTVGMATQGLANYLLQSFPDQQIKVAIAYDSRNNSRLFAQTTADVFSANGIYVYLFEDLRPTPELSYAIRMLGCKSGVVVTASHNPKEYNGYKAYWEDGAQLVPPHDKNVIDEVKKITDLGDVNFERNTDFIEEIGEDIDNDYLEMLASHVLEPEAIKSESDLGIVYSSIHGTGITMVPPILQKLGFRNLHIVRTQEDPDGDFPTVVYPNPEEAEAMTQALDMAEDMDADLVMATDPDSDRVGIAVKNQSGNFQLLNGNQTAVLLIHYLLYRMQSQQNLKPNSYIVKTIVTTDLIARIAEHFKVPCYDTLTGFKYIAEVIRLREKEGNFIGGGEESYGYLVGDEVRDKDAIGSCAMIAEMAAYWKSQKKSLYDQLISIYREYGMYRERLVSITKKGREGAGEIQEMMRNFRENPPEKIADVHVAKILDYKTGVGQDLRGVREFKIDLPSSNVLQFILEDGSKISARPSGTEPKIKFYVSVQGELDNRDVAEAEAKLDERISELLQELGIE